MKRSEEAEKKAQRGRRKIKIAQCYKPQDVKLSKRER